MIEREIIKHVPEFISLAVPIILAFSQKERAWFIERDEGQCQFPVSSNDDGYTPCGREERLHVHHVVPQRWGEAQGVPSEEVDSQDNGITLCINHHLNVIHGSDMPLAQANYSKDKNSYKKAFAKRDRLVADGKKYWNDAWDAIFLKIIEARNKAFDKPFK